MGFRKVLDGYVNLEREARAARTGLWRNESGPQPPWEYRAKRWALAEQIVLGVRTATAGQGSETCHEHTRRQGAVEFLLAGVF